MTERTCTRCGVTYPATLEFFYRSRTTLTSRCKPCLIELSTEWAKTTEDRRRQVHRAYYLKNKEKIKARAAKWNKDHPEKHRQHDKTYENRNPEKVRTMKKNWDDRNPEKKARNSNRRRAKKKAAQTEPYTTQQVLDLYGTDCYLCHEPIDLTAPRRAGRPGWERGLHIDHVKMIMNSGPDTIENVRPSHGKCNLSRLKKVRSEISFV